MNHPIVHVVGESHAGMRTWRVNKPDENPKTAETKSQ